MRDSVQFLLPDDNTGLLPISYFHALARLGEEGLILIEPDKPFVSLGYFDPEEVVDLDYCAAHDIPVMRRETGGGMVLLGPGQVFYTLVVKRPHPPVPSIVQDSYRHLSQAPIAVYQQMGIPARLRPVNDIVTGQGRKIGGQGAADINGHFCFVGSILLDFDCELMHHVVRLPHKRLKGALKNTLSANMTSIRRETGRHPDADHIKRLLADAFAPLVGGLEPAAISERLLRETRSVAVELAANVQTGEKAPPRPLFKIQEGLYLCQRLLETPAGDTALSVSIRDDIVTAVHATRHPDKDMSAALAGWIGRRFAADALPIEQAARALDLRPTTLRSALFPTGSTHVAPGVAEELEPRAEGARIRWKP